MENGEKMSDSTYKFDLQRIKERLKYPHKDFPHKDVLGLVAEVERLQSQLDVGQKRCDEQIAFLERALLNSKK